MPNTVEIFLLLLCTYSFAGWVLETSAASIQHKSFKNRGFGAGPFCYVYGVTALILTLFLQDLRSKPFALFVACTIISTIIEWTTAKMLERLRHQRWWDYSNKPFNIDGYVCLPYSLLWGAFGTAVVLFVNDFLVRLYTIIPPLPRIIISWTIFIISFVDIAGTGLVFRHSPKLLPWLLSWNRSLSLWTMQAGENLSKHVQNRVNYSYQVRQENTAVLLDTFGLNEIFWVFILGAFLGDIVETIFCRFSIGYWMSRSSLVFGPFSIVWGLAMALSAVLLRKSATKSDSYLFIIGTFAGGTFEYLCSVFTEIVFGKKFWDYSHLPYNLNGRVCLLFCFFWGIAAVVWIRWILPRLLKFIALIRRKTGYVLTGFFAVFMALDIFISSLALLRYDERGKGITTTSAFFQTVDALWPDETMEKIYPMARDA